MQQFRNILVPIHFYASGTPDIDLAADSKEALAQAGELAKESGSVITFAHVFAGREDPGASSDDGELPRIRRIFDRLVADLVADGIEARWVFLFGHPPEEILSLATTEGMDLVLLGTRQRPGQGPPIGSTAAAILSSSRVPVWIVKPTSPGHGSIVIAADLVASSGEVLRSGTILAGQRGAQLHVVHACQCERSSGPRGLDPELQVCRAKLECEMANVAHDLPVPLYTCHVIRGKAEDVIWNLARKVQAGVVIVGLHEHSIVEWLLRPHTAEQLLAELPCSLFAVPVA